MGEVATIELPPGDPGAVADSLGALERVSGGFERAGGAVASAVSGVGSWEGRASVAFQDRAASYKQTLAAVEGALAGARGAVRRYQGELEEARDRLQRLRRREEDCVERFNLEERRLNEARGRAEGARGRVAQATLSAGALVGDPFSLGEQAGAQRELEQAEADVGRAERAVERERKELDRLREKATDESERIEEVEGTAAAAVRQAAGELPDVQLPTGEVSPSPFAGTVFDPLNKTDFQRRVEAAAVNDTDDDDGVLDKLGGAIDDAWDWTAPARHGAGNATSGFTNELTFGWIDLGGDKNSGAYKGGKIASYVPWNPASALKSLGTGVVKVGGKVIAKKGAKRGADDAAGAGGRGPGAGAVATVPPPKRWGPHNGPGPLGERYARTFRSASYTERVLTQDTYLYRAWGGESGDVGRFWSADPPAGPLQSKLDSALPPGNSAENTTVIRVPAGTTVYEGAVAPDFGRMGGGSQVVLEGDVPRRWIVRTGRGFGGGP